MATRRHRPQLPSSALTRAFDGDVNVVAVVCQYRYIVDDFRAVDGVGGEVLFHGK
jgi:hypothetical protein